MAVEAETYKFFEGVTWWVYELINFQRNQYAVLLREDIENPLSLITNYGRIHDGQLTPMTVEEKRKLATHYRNLLSIRIQNEGERAIPWPGKIKSTGKFIT